MFKHDLKAGESIRVGDAVIKLQSKNGQCCTLVIDAPREVLIQTNPKPTREQEEQAAS